MYRIETDSLNLEIEIVPVAALRPHEQILPGVAARLRLEFQNLALLHNPVIVDRNHVVLDGNHRAAVFRSLNFRYIPVCRIDYFNRAARLRYWFRRLENTGGPRAMADAVKRCGGRLVPVGGPRRLQSSLERRGLCCGLQQAGRCYLVEFPARPVADAKAAYARVQELQEVLEARGAAIEYVPCRLVRRDRDFARGNDNRAVIWTPPITKEMVVETACRRRVLPPKTTRHLIPARPLHIDVSSQWLRERVPLESINARFRDHLRARRLKKFGAGQVVDGRYYEEDLYIFYDPRRSGRPAALAGKGD